MVPGSTLMPVRPLSEASQQESTELVDSTNRFRSVAKRVFRSGRGITILTVLRVTFIIDQSWN